MFHLQCSALATAPDDDEEWICPVCKVSEGGREGGREGRNRRGDFKKGGKGKGKGIKLSERQ